MNITVRAVDQELWRELKVEVAKKGLTVGEAVNTALRKWLQVEPQKNRHKSFWDVKPIKLKGNGASQASLSVDEVLYR